MATQTEIEAGAAALRSYIDQMLEAEGLSWEEGFIPDQTYTTGATDALTAADASIDQSPTARQAAATTALRSAIDSTGEGSQVTDQECQEAALAILDAVDKIRTSTGESYGQDV